MGEKKISGVQMIFELCMRINPNYGEIKNSKGLVQCSATGNIFSPQEILKFCFCMQWEVILRSLLQLNSESIYVSMNICTLWRCKLLRSLRKQNLHLFRNFTWKFYFHFSFFSPDCLLYTIFTVISHKYIWTNLTYYTVVQAWNRS